MKVNLIQSQYEIELSLIDKVSLIKYIFQSRSMQDLKTSKLKGIQKKRKHQKKMLRKLNIDHLYSTRRKKQTFSFNIYQERGSRISSNVEPQYQTLIQTYQSLAYELMDMPKLLSLLDKRDLMMTFKSIIGLSQLSESFKDTQFLRESLNLGIIPKLTSTYLNFPNPFIKISSVHLLKTISYWLPRQEDHSRYFNSLTIPPSFLRTILTQDRNEKSLSLVTELFQKEYKLNLIQEKEQMISAIKNRLQNISLNSFDQDVQKLIKILSKINLLNYQESQKLNSKICEILILMMEKVKNRQNYNIVLGYVQQLLINPSFVKSIDNILEKEPTSMFHRRYPDFCCLFHIIMTSSTQVNYQERKFFMSRPLLKYMTKSLSINLLEKMEIFQKIENQLLLEKIQSHSDDWEIAISALNIIERLFSKNHKETLQRFLANKHMLIKIKELYNVDDKNLFEQLNKTVSKMISTDNSYLLLEMLKKGGIIKMYLTPCEGVKVHQNVVLQEMKDTYERVDKRLLRKGHNEFMKLLRRSIIQSIDYTTVWRGELNDFYRRIFDIQMQS